MKSRSPGPANRKTSLIGQTPREGKGNHVRGVRESCGDGVVLLRGSANRNCAKTLPEFVDAVHYFGRFVAFGSEDAGRPDEQIGPGSRETGLVASRHWVCTHTVLGIR